MIGSHVTNNNPEHAALIKRVTTHAESWGCRVQPGTRIDDGRQVVNYTKDNMRSFWDRAAPDLVITTQSCGKFSLDVKTTYFVEVCCFMRADVIVMGLERGPVIACPRLCKNFVLRVPTCNGNREPREHDAQLLMSGLEHRGFQVDTFSRGPVHSGSGDPHISMDLDWPPLAEWGCRLFTVGPGDWIHSLKGRC